MTIRYALGVGLRKALASPTLLLGLWLGGLLLALPAAVMMTESIRSSVGPSLVHENLRSGLDMEWLSEFEHAAKGIETTLRPISVTAGALFDNLEKWMSGELFTGNRLLVGLGCFYALAWLLLLGGVLDRYTQDRGALNLSDFFSACGQFFLRFLRLFLISGVFYFAIYRFGRWIFPRIDESTRHSATETTILLYNLGGVVTMLVLLMAVSIVFDYAKIATVAEDRRSMLMASFRGLLFVLAHPFQTVGLYLMLALVGLLLMIGYALLPNFTGAASWGGILVAFALGQLYLITRLVLRLTFLSAQSTLYTRFQRAKARRVGGKRKRPRDRGFEIPDKSPEVVLLDR